MAWRVLPASEVLDRFTPAERAALSGIQQGTTTLNERLEEVVVQFTAAIAAAGGEVVSGQVPDQLRRFVGDMAAWAWLKDFPTLEALRTKAREKAAEKAEDVLEAISKWEYGAIESPNGVDRTTGNWNSRPKLTMRTDPIPSPQDQLQLTPTPVYANPNAPADEVPTNSPDVPSAPGNLRAQSGVGKVTLTWDPALNAETYSVYRGTDVPDSEAAVALATTADANYIDTAVAVGHTYYYRLTGVNGSLESDRSNEVSGTPT